MKLPYADQAVVDHEKIVDYLLNAAHPDNGGKAAFFLALGYQKDDWLSLAAALRQLAVAGEVTKSVETVHGIKYVVGRWSPDGTHRPHGGRSYNLDC